MIQEVLNKHKKYFDSGRTRSLDFRLEQLNKLYYVIKSMENEILDALKKDLNKSEFEAYTNEVGFVYDSIKYMKKHLKSWMKTQKVKTPIHQFGSKSYYDFIPYGTVLIIGPFNYPFQLLIEPMIGAIAAGNTVVLKPSEYTSETEKVIAKLIKRAFKEEYVKVVTGGVDETTELINSRFDYIFFTGSVPVGKIIMKAAAENLIPVTLELGGKSPTIVDHTANINLAAKRIAWGKFINAGQTCVAPDYVYVHESVEDEFKEALKKHIHDFYGNEIHESSDFGRIVSERHHNRLKGLIDDEKVYTGGLVGENKFLAPTIMHQVTWDDPVMQDEIFGPILPVMAYKDIHDVLDVINGYERPLALYLFTENKKTEKLVLDQTTFGGGCINDTISHVASSHLPFGGVGHSGMGGYHGKFSFETFSHRRSIVKKSTKLDIKLVFPPYNDKLKLARKFMK